jgi:uncharacterized protein YggE
MNQFHPLFITSTTLLTSVFIALTSPGSFADGDEDDRRILTVSAQSSVEIPMTHARITIMIEARGKTPKEAQSSITRRSNPVLDFLKSEEVEKLQTSGLSLTPIFESRQKRPDIWNIRNEIVGYSAQWTTSFEVTVERAGEIADAVIEKGADRISSFQLKATDQAVETARTEALSDAAKLARDRGIAVLASLDYELDEIVRIHVNDVGPVYPRRAMRGEAMSMATDAGPSTAIEGGMQKIPGSVQLKIAY